MTTQRNAAIVAAAQLSGWRTSNGFPGLCQGRASCRGGNAAIGARSPVDGSAIDVVGRPDGAEINAAVAAAQAAFLRWREIPAPRRGELVRRIAALARARKAALADLITLETGKVREEALGEVQELIDICDFAVGLSRQLYGLSIASERSDHRLMEQWHPLGPVAIVTAFNFPMAVWAWNAMLALVCGDTLLWKPSPRAPLCALACHALVAEAAQALPEAPADLSAVIQGDDISAAQLADDARIALVSATGSSRMGRALAQRVGARLGRYLLELGGNNAMIVSAKADFDLALRAIVFAATGTCGQRCTSLRRLIVHESVIDHLSAALCRAYRTLRIGDPFVDGTHVGPLIDEPAALCFEQALQRARDDGGDCLRGGGRSVDGVAGGVYVEPALVRMPAQTAIVRTETFAPLLYLLAYRDLDEAIALHNAVPQGLSSAIFTRDIREAEIFLSARGSDCGIANVNAGTSGAEIGGAFGGEKDSGGGRESGSDAWKNYMRRSTNTINYGADLPLAQGIRFDFG